MDILITENLKLLEETLTSSSKLSNRRNCLPKKKKEVLRNFFGVCDSVGKFKRNEKPMVMVICIRASFQGYLYFT